MRWPSSIGSRPSRRGPPRTLVVVDLGTGSGAIGLSIAAERQAVDVWLTDRSDDALAVARANLAGLGRAGTRVRVSQGSWFDALPAELEGAVDLLVSNPPYVASDDDLPEVVRAWEPSTALFAGPDGLDDIRALISGAPRWLHDGGALVLELAPSQAPTATALAVDAGFADVTVEPDLSGRLRCLVARRRPEGSA